tara:strand:- start:592 stop:750 length:159 start_codon:yes stop_codon:yes gene_type:complete
MRLNLVLETDNAAFEGDTLAEVKRILSKEFYDYEDKKLRDINGNVVGSIKWT